MKKILVTGSNGLLGQKLMSLILSTSRAELIATSRGSNRYPATEGYLYEDLDITSTEKVREVILKHNPDVIINTAAITNVDQCHEERELCRAVNVTAVEQLARLCEERTIHLIHLSTDFVFDGKEGPYSEDDEPNPLSYYGQSKRDAEEIVMRSTCRWTIIRTILVYGITTNLSRSNIVLWVKKALENGESIRVVNDQWRMPTLAEDLAEACLRAAERSVEGVLHVSGKDFMSVVELALAVAGFWQLDKSKIQAISSAMLNQEAKRPAKTGFILDKAIKQLSYSPHSFREGMEILDKQFLSILNEKL